MHSGIDIAHMPFVKIFDLSIKERISAHATAYVFGQLDDTADIGFILSLNAKSDFKITIKYSSSVEELSPKLVFAGRLKDFELSFNAGKKFIKLNLISLSYNLDEKADTARFNNPSKKYMNIFKKIVEDIHNGVCLDHVLEPESKEQGGLIVKYRETDWQFLKRLASHAQTVISTKMEDDKIKIIVGFPNGGVADLDGQLIKKNFHFGTDSTEYIVQSNEYHDLCGKVSFDGETCIITKKTIELREGIFVKIYALSPEDFTVPVEYNHLIAGAALKGKVTEIDSARPNYVRVLLNDDYDGAKDSEWIQVATVYSGEGEGIHGVHVMPEIGAEVSLYFPEAQEKLAYIASSFHPEADNENLETHEVKQFDVLGNRFKMETEALKLHTKEDKMAFEMHKEEGISIVGNDSILMGSNGIELRLNSDLKITSEKEVEFKTNSSSVLLSGDVEINATGLVNL